MEYKLETYLRNVCQESAQYEDLDRQSEDIKAFWNKGTSTDKAKRFQSVDELFSAVRRITG